MEIKGLEALASMLSQTLHTQRAKLAHSIHSHTLRGRLSSTIGRIFAGYCIFRTFIVRLGPFILPLRVSDAFTRQAAYNVSFLSRFRQPQAQQQTYPDIFTNVLVWLFVPSSPSPTSLLTPESISSLARHTSLLLIGFILLSSIGLVMRGVKRVCLGYLTPT